MESFANCMKCDHCHIPINIHKCKTVEMDKTEVVLLDDLKKKALMTYGLGGCSAFIIINKQKNIAILGHYPESYKVVNIVENFSNDDSIIIIKTPGKWNKNEQTNIWDFIPSTNNYDYLIKKFNTTIIPYSLIKKSSSNSIYKNSYSSSLYLFIKNNNICTYDNYGRIITITEY